MEVIKGMVGNFKQLLKYFKYTNTFSPTYIKNTQTILLNHYQKPSKFLKFIYNNDFSLGAH